MVDNKPAAKPEARVPVVRDTATEERNAAVFGKQRYPQRDYTASATVDGQQLALKLSEDVSGTQGNGIAELYIGEQLFQAQALRHGTDGYDSMLTPNIAALAHTGPAGRATDEMIGNQARLQQAHRAPAMIQMFRQVMADGQVTESEFRQIRNAFRAVDPASAQATNAHLPPPTPRARTRN